VVPKDQKLPMAQTPLMALAVLKGLRLLMDLNDQMDLRLLMVLTVH
jgi:hypothetical protein